MGASESEDDEGIDDYEEDDESLDDEDRETVESLFVKIVQQMRLSDLETAALRLAIAKNDSAVKDAMEAYRSTMNTQDMISSLKQIARKYVVEYDIDDNYNEKSEDDGDEDEEYLRKLEEEAGYERLEDEESEEENDADSEGCDDDLDQ